ncbi:hypothetical protein MKX01_030998 [Papaver californicum]|nr:hypothetical protein MKX01_030998 [Papaver californicum]
MWRKVSKEPLLFHSIDIRNRSDLLDDNMYDVEKMARETVSGSFRYLRLISCYQVINGVLINVAKKAVMMEEIEICHCAFSEDMLKTVGKVCPQLNSFRLNCQGFRRPWIL